ncbi:hypothetical protein [Clavibacter sp.]|uniref:hypothetical protein n=1 Tax=Clavibacter sp. TaxID=1871044 RepID=UPI0019B84113|nr:hypothetical protein [Clavibacter sp.]MBD5381901.1 hypothetical protein [Clavibacter sp.]
MTTIVKNAEVSKDQKIENVVNVIASEATSTRAIIRALWEVRNNSNVADFANVIFADCNDDTSAKVAISAGLKRYIQLWEVKIVDAEGKPQAGKKIKVAKGVYTYEALPQLLALREAVTGYYNGVKQITVESGKYYDENNNTIDYNPEKAKEERKEKAQKTKEEKAKKQTEETLKNTDIITLLNSALVKAESAELKKAIATAISLA